MAQKYVGQALNNRDAQLLLTGQAVFADDVRLTDPLHLAFLRSAVSNARIRQIQVQHAEVLDGVVAVHIGRDTEALGQLSVNPVLPISGQLKFPVLAQSLVSAVGQPVAAVLADNLSIAQDAVERLLTDYTELVNKDDTKPLAQQRWCHGDPHERFKHADFVVQCELHHARLAPSPMEPRAIAIEYDQPSDSVTIWHSTQTPHRTRSELAAILSVHVDRIQVIASHVGGAFGMKASLYPEEVFAVWAAFKHRRSVKWTASRSEDFLAATHGRGVVSRGRLAVNRDGRFIALEANVNAPLGHWLPNSALITAWNSARILPAGYRIDAVDIQTTATQENRAPMGIYRGAGRPEANCLMERLVDAAARATGICPIAIRERNLLAASELPYDTPTGNRLDSGDYPMALRRLRELGGYDQLMVRRETRRAQGKLSGIGLGFYLEPSGSGWESAQVCWHADGLIEVATGSSSQGHGRGTAFAQIAADALHVHIDQVIVRCGDTINCPPGIGALASRSTAIGGSAVLQACEELVTRRQSGEALPMTADVQYENIGQAWGYGCYLVALEIDAQTGQVNVERAVCVDDAGLIVNSAQANGQIIGGFAQGLGEALMEQIIYDDNNELLTGSFLDYAMPRAGDVPHLTVHKVQTLSPFNKLGAKGVGEAGTIGAPGAVLNAALDALSGLGIEELDMPLTPYKLWHAIQATRQMKGKE